MKVFDLIKNFVEKKSNEDSEDNPDLGLKQTGQLSTLSEYSNPINDSEQLNKRIMSSIISLLMKACPYLCQLI